MKIDSAAVSGRRAGLKPAPTQVPWDATAIFILLCGLRKAIVIPMIEVDPKEGHQLVKAPSLRRSSGGKPPGSTRRASAASSSNSTPRPGRSGQKA